MFKTALCIPLLLLASSASASQLASPQEFLNSTTCKAGVVKYVDDYVLQCEYTAIDGSTVKTSYHPNLDFTITLTPNSRGKLVANDAFESALTTALDFGNAKNKNKIIHFFKKLPLNPAKEEVDVDVYGTKIMYPNKKSVQLYKNYLMTVNLDA
ncbi:hypothetical protein [Photobacterium leiognathi]|uniref:hypothetical protein n=1 Tax=Photobacterium leiognathi TaxID=553611 RepID=UPI002982B7E5|nr:hypothetical protein [Photobacterium leiognathi]